MDLELQKILMPKPDTCMNETLYYHRNEKVYLNVESSSLTFQQSGRATFDTYFNGFSIGKWRKYTILENLKLKLELSGCFIVSIVNYELINGVIVSKVIDEQLVTAVEKTAFTFSYEGFHQKGMHTFILLATEEDSVFYGGSYYTDEVSEDQLNPVKLALNMCTYMREKYIKRNVNKIREELIENSESPLYDNLRLYITDNAMTLNEADFSAPYLTLTKQNAFGSVGGFTRGLVNILHDRETCGLTHVLMLDDDIVLDPQVLCRLYALLQMMKKTNLDAWVGGGMLGLDFPTLQAESGGVIENGKYVSIKQLRDVSSLPSVLHNELEEGAGINAWWFCCIPLSTIGEDKLPYPVYFHCDDMEYAARCCKKLILLNGLSVWHEEFFYKPDTHYFDKRNMEILFSLHFPQFANKRSVKKRLIKNVLNSVLWYRYHDAEEILDGVSDFLKGPEWLVHTDDRAKFEEVRKNRIPSTPVDQQDFPFDYNQYLDSLSYPGESRKRRLFRRLTLNGWLLPANRDLIIRAETPITFHFYRARRVMNYSAKNHSAYMSYKSYRKAFAVAGKLLRTLVRIDREYGRARESYRNSISAYTSLEFWQNKYDAE